MRDEEAMLMTDKARSLERLRDDLRGQRREEQKTYRAGMAVEIGDYTYGTPKIRSWGEKNAKLMIGKFCSIGANVKIYLGGNHRNEWMTTYPFNALPQLRGIWSDIDDGVAATKGDVIIGNDVWIADDVSILSGVTIGDGATIAKGAVVAKNIPAYTVAGGVPAEAKRTRWAAKAVADMKWWDLPTEQLAEVIPMLMSSDIQALRTYMEGMK